MHMMMKKKIGSTIQKNDIAHKFQIYKNRLNGETVLVHENSKTRIIDDVLFVEVICNGRKNYMRKENLEFVSDSDWLYNWKELEWMYKV